MSLSLEYSKINPNEVACGTRKKYAPYKCEVVPAEYLKIIVAKYPKLCEFVFWTCFFEWMRDTRKRPTVRQLNAARKKWWLHPLSIKLQGIIQRQLNYERSTFISGHILHRYGKVYRQMMGYSWHYYDAHGPNRTVIFYKNNIEIARIPDR